MKEYAINEYNEWVEDDNIRNSWEHEDYEDVTVYQSKSLDIICIRRDANGTIVDAWVE